MKRILAGCEGENNGKAVLFWKSVSDNTDRFSVSVMLVYAGYLGCFLPIVFCQSEWPAQTRFRTANHTLRSFQNHSNTYHRSPPTSKKNERLSVRLNNTEDNHSNYTEADRWKAGYKREPLLIGYAHDPYRHSILNSESGKNSSSVSARNRYINNDNRGKRGVVHLYNMISCATGCDPLSYKGYGCYCGFLGEGRSVDGIDRCCKLHDRCYENLFCPFFTVYFQPYYWKCYRGQPLCALENYDTQNQFINGCAAKLCECDKQLSMCLRTYPCPRRRALCRSSPLRLLQNLIMS